MSNALIYFGIDWDKVLTSTGAAPSHGQALARLVSRFDAGAAKDGKVR